MNKLGLIFTLVLMAAQAQAVTVSPMPMPKLEFRNAAGSGPCAGCLIYTYEPASTTLKISYTDSTGTVANANPVVADTAGRASIWADGCYKIILKSSAGVTIATQDGLCEYQTASITVSQWQTSGLTPTYLGATSFSVPGDQTGTFTTGLRLQSTVTGGTIYSTVVSSSYGASVTTVTVVNDSGTLDSGLSVVSTGILSPSNPSSPVRAVSTKTVGYTILPTDCGSTINANLLASAATFTLPDANAVPSGCEITTKNTSTWTLTIAGTVDGTISPSLYQYGELKVRSSGSAWYGNTTIPNLFSAEAYSTSSGLVTIATATLGDVSVGDRILACTSVIWTPSATGSHSIGIAASPASTATINFFDNSATILANKNIASSGVTDQHNICGVAKVTVAGTLAIKPNYVYTGTPTNATWNAYAIFLKRK